MKKKNMSKKLGALGIIVGISLIKRDLGKRDSLCLGWAGPPSSPFLVKGLSFQSKVFVIPVLADSALLQLSSVCWVPALPYVPSDCS